MDHRKKRAKRFQVFDPRSRNDRLCRQAFACSKACYASKSEALAQLKRICTSGTPPPDVHRMGAYRCERCSAWHLGHSDTGGKEGRRWAR